MKIKIKKKGLLSDKKEKYSLPIDKVFFKKSLGGQDNKVQIFFKKKNVSGVIELPEKDLREILKKY